MPEHYDHSKNVAAKEMLIAVILSKVNFLRLILQKVLSGSLAAQFSKKELWKKVLNLLMCIQWCRSTVVWQCIGDSLTTAAAPSSAVRPMMLLKGRHSEF